MSQNFLSQALTYLNMGDTESARALLVQLAQQQPDDTPWLYLTLCVDTDGEKRYCFERALLFVLTGVVIVLGRYLLRQRMMEHASRLVEGRVLECSGSYDSDGDLWVRIRYEFVSPSTGLLLQGTKRLVRNDLRPSGSDPTLDARLPDDLLSRRGTPVLVMYADDAFFEIL